MLLRSLEVFLATAEFGQMTLAANKLGISQSAVSQHLSNLESYYGTKLIDRSLRPFGLTLTGVALQQHARQLLRQAEAISGDLYQLEHKNVPLLRVGLLPSLATLLSPHIIDVARNHFHIPQVLLFAELASAHETLLKSRQIDMAISSRAFYELEELNHKPMLEEDFLLILPKDHSTVADLSQIDQNLPLVRFAAATPVGLLVDLHLRRCEVDYPRILEADRTTMIMAAVAAGQGFTILSPTLLFDGLLEGMALSIQALPLPRLCRQIFLISRQQELGELPQNIELRIRKILSEAIAGISDQCCRDAIKFV